MPTTTFSQDEKKFELQLYRKPKNIAELQKNCVPFSGSPRKHPYASNKVVLMSDPYSSGPVFYEFKTENIQYAQELSNIVNMDGETIPMVRIWVKKRSIAVRSSPFIVEDTVALAKSIAQT